MGIDVFIYLFLNQLWEVAFPKELSTSLRILALSVYICVCFLFFIFIYFFIFCLFRAIPMAFGGSQARGRIRTVAAGLHHSHSNARSELRLQPTPQPTAMPDP